MLRNKIWHFALRNHLEGSRLSQPLLALRAVLFPLDFLCAHRSYDPRTDVWNIHGVKYSGAALRMLAEADNVIYKIKREDSVITLMHLPKMETKELQP